MNPVPQPGKPVLFLTADRARTEQLLSHAKGFKEIFFVELEVRSVLRYVDGVYSRLVVDELDEERVARKRAVSPQRFITRTLPTAVDSLVVVMFTPSMSLAPPPPPALSPSTAVVGFAPSLDSVPDRWLQFFDEVVELWLADKEDIKQVLGMYDARFEGLTYGELLTLKAKSLPSLAEMVLEADKLRVKRLMAAGLKPENPAHTLDTIPVDPYLAQHLRKHLTMGRTILLVGPSGSGKTYLASAMASSMKTPVYSLSASVFLQAHRSSFGEMLNTLRHAVNTSIVLNEFDRLVDAEPRLKTSFLTHLETVRKNAATWMACTAVDPDKLLEKRSKGEINIEMVRPGRMDEVIPMPPPFLRETKTRLVKTLAPDLPDDIVYKIVDGFDMMYAYDYLSLITRVKNDGASALNDFDIDEESRRKKLLHLLDVLTEVGNTSTYLVNEIEKHLTTRWCYM
ncbi:MAG: AAA family ATPase [Candidatus Caldarchaeum sp.]